MNKGYRCPRCGNTDIHGRVDTFVTEDREADRWDPIRELTLFCLPCDYHETGKNTEHDNYAAFLDRWNDPDFVHPTAAEIEADNRAHRARMEEHERSRTWPEEDEVTDRARRWAKVLRKNRHSEWALEAFRQRGQAAPATKRGYEEDHALLDRIAQEYDSDVPRLEYAAWLRGINVSGTEKYAEFIEVQLQISHAFRNDPKTDLAPFRGRRLFHTEFTPTEWTEEWWRLPGGNIHAIPGDPVWADRSSALYDEGLVADCRLMRGFIEHVAMKASRFLELADEVYSLMPIRHLTLTYCKGLKHDDVGLLRALLDSPHLDRIRSLRFPARHIENQYMELNRWTDADVALLAESKHLKNLRFLGFEDAGALSRGAYEALAASTEVPLLSHVQHSRYNYGFAHYGMGKFTKQLDYPNILDAHTEALEDKYGYIPWCHYFENYGTSTPDVEAVCEHPVALLRPR